MPLIFKIYAVWGEWGERRIFFLNFEIIAVKLDTQYKELFILLNHLKVKLLTRSVISHDYFNIYFPQSLFFNITTTRLSKLFYWMFLNFNLSDISSCLESHCASLAKISEKWCCDLIVAYQVVQFQFVPLLRIFTLVVINVVSVRCLHCKNTLPC